MEKQHAHKHTNKKDTHPSLISYNVVPSMFLRQVGSQHIKTATELRKDQMIGITLRTEESQMTGALQQKDV